MNTLSEDTIVDDIDWFNTNNEYLSLVVEQFKYLLRISYPKYSEEKSDEKVLAFEQKTELKRKRIPGIAPIDYLTDLYGLTKFEKNILLLSIAPDLDSSFIYPLGHAEPIFVNFSLAMAIIPDAEWSSITANGTLRRNGLIELDDTDTLTAAKLIIPESILHFILGIHSEDDAVQLVSERDECRDYILDEKNKNLAEDIYQLWMDNHSFSANIFTLTGACADIKRDIAALLALKLEMKLKILPAFFIPTDIKELQKFIIMWDREMTIKGYLLFIECDNKSESDSTRDRMLDFFIDKLKWPVLISSDDKRTNCKKEQYAFDVKMPDMSEQKLCWNTNLPEYENDVDISEVCSHFSLTFRDIKKYSFAYKTLNKQDSLWSVCRTFNKEKVGNLVQNIDTSLGEVNLILPQRENDILEQIVSQVKLRSLVHEQWGFMKNSSRGKGISVLFSGASGTGKTTAAEYLAAKLDLDLYRIELSSMVSKYIGETEKNLQSIFQSAEKSGAILLFDEADALFGKRTQVKDSHDKHANTAVSFLLQRIESFSGLAILTSNLKDSFDNAFIRRLRFIVQFPFPSANERARIWEVMLPNNAPSQNIDFSKLAQLNVAGGSICNITMNACFAAAAGSEIIQMKHYLAASRNEYEKLEKNITAMEINGWL